MLLSTELEGSTVEKVYWAVPSKDWLPVIGDKFDTYQDASRRVDQMFENTGNRTAIITNRIVVRKSNGTTIDMEVDRERKFR